MFAMNAVRIYSEIRMCSMGETTNEQDERHRKLCAGRILTFQHPLRWKASTGKPLGIWNL